MKSITLLTLIIVITTWTYGVSARESTYGENNRGKWIIGGKVANLDTNQAGVNDAEAAGVVLGYEFAQPIGEDGTASVELEYLRGDETLISIEDPFQREYSTDVVNLFFTYRSGGQIYFKLKRITSCTSFLQYDI